MKYESIHTILTKVPSQGTCMLIIIAHLFKWNGNCQLWSEFRELWSPARQQLWTWRRSKVKVTAWRHLKGFVTRIMHAKYQCSIFNTSEDISQVKVFVTDRRRDGQTDEWDLMSPRFRESGGQKWMDGRRARQTQSDDTRTWSTVH